MVPEPSTEPMAVAGYPPASASAAVPVCNLPPVPDLDMLLPPAASPAPKVLPAPQPAILHLAIDSRAQTAAATAAAPADATGPAAMDAQPTQPGGGLCMQPSSFSDTLPFAEELAAVAAQLSVSVVTVHVQHLPVSGRQQIHDVSVLIAMAAILNVGHNTAMIFAYPPSSN